MFSLDIVRFNFKLFLTSTKIGDLRLVIMCRKCCREFQPKIEPVKKAVKTLPTKTPVLH